MQTAFHSRDRAGKLDAEATEVLVPPASPAPPPLSYLGAFRPQREQRDAPFPHLTRATRTGASRSGESSNDTSTIMSLTFSNRLNTLFNQGAFLGCVLGRKTNPQETPSHLRIQRLNDEPPPTKTTQEPYNAASDGDPMTWVANNLTDSSTYPYAGNLRDFVTKLAGLGKSATPMPENPTVSEDGKSVTYTMPDDGLYLIFDTTGDSGAATGSIPMLVGTKLTVKKGAQTQIPTANINGEVNVKNEITTVEKTVDPTAPSIGDRKTYTIKGNVPNWVGKTGTKYTFTDQPSKGQDVDFGTISVFLDTDKNGAYDEGTDRMLTSGTDYTVSGTSAFQTPAGQIKADGDSKFTIDLTGYMKNASVNASLIGTQIVATYKVVINTDALANQVTNTVTVNNNDSTATDSTTNDDFNEPASFEFTKYQSDGTTVLAGAKFTVTKDEMQLGFTKADDGSYVYGQTAEPTTLETPESGKVTVKGLGAGTYTVAETDAPEGYLNLGLPSFTVTVNADGTVEYTEDSDAFDLVAIAGTTVSVKNVKSVTQLPLTGAAGTALFTVLGLLIAGAGARVYMKSSNVKHALRG